MVVRRVSTRIYFAAGLLTLLVLAAGLLVGSFIADLRASFLEQWHRQQVGEFERTERRQLELANSRSAKNCAVTQGNLLGTMDDVDTARGKLERYRASTLARYNSRLLQLNREYSSTALRYWLLSSEISKMCQIADPPVLYLYSGRGCDGCRFREEALTFVKDKYGQRSVVFAVDSDLLREEEIKSIRKSHSVTTGPPLIIVGSRDNGLFTNIEESLRRVIQHDGTGLR